MHLVQFEPARKRLDRNIQRAYFRLPSHESARSKPFKFAVPGRVGSGGRRGGGAITRGRVVRGVGGAQDGAVAGISPRHGRPYHEWPRHDRPRRPRRRAAARGNPRLERAPRGAFLPRGAHPPVGPDGARTERVTRYRRRWRVPRRPVGRLDPPPSPRGRAVLRAQRRHEKPPGVRGRRARAVESCPLARCGAASRLV